MCGRYGRRGDKQRIAEWMQTHNTNVFDVLRAKLQLPLTWINESEHVDFVDLRLITLNIAIERLRIEFLPKSTMNYSHADWRQLLHGELASEILKADETKTGVLSDEQKRALVSKLRSANTPSALFLLEELCLGLGVNGLEKDMGILRNRLTHSASYGNFDFSKVIDLQYKLSTCWMFVFSRSSGMRLLLPQEHRVAECPVTPRPAGYRRTFRKYRCTGCGSNLRVYSATPVYGKIEETRENAYARSVDLHKY